MKPGGLLALVGMGTIGLVSGVWADPPSSNVQFERIPIDAAFRAEGVAVADLTGDGKPDIAAGSVYYAAPDWKPQPIADSPKSFPPEQYSDVFACFADDVNHDGRVDVITIDMPGKETWWFENPGPAGGAWRRHLAVRVTNNENPIFADVFGEGRRVLVCGYSPDPNQPDSPKRYMVFARPGPDPYAPWLLQRFSTDGAPGSARYYHGLGVGDINGDRRNDVVVYEGWWEQPEAGAEKPWTFHPAKLGEHAAQMLVYDFDGDGDADVLSTSAHRYGIWWHEQTSNGWKTHTIDQSVSQTHAVVLADVNGDGLMDFVTGKRWWAHVRGDPGTDEPAMLLWFELARKDRKPVWTKHPIDDNSGVGLQFEVTDVDGDGLVDVVTSNKKGVYYFRQKRNK